MLKRRRGDGSRSFIGGSPSHWSLGGKVGRVDRGTGFWFLVSGFWFRNQTPDPRPQTCFGVVHVVERGGEGFDLKSVMKMNGCGDGGMKMLRGWGHPRPDRAPIAP